MNLDEVAKKLREIIIKLKIENNIVNQIVREEVFNVLEKNADVLYYPLEDEENCGLHIKRYINGEKKDFVYINTAKPYTEQVFAAAHELGHVWGVIERLGKEMQEVLEYDENEKEAIINRFAAELLMPIDDFKITYLRHIEELRLEEDRVSLSEYVRVIVMQMNDYMSSYDAVKRRLRETGLIGEGVAKILEERDGVIRELVDVYLKEYNTFINEPTGRKAVPGLRDLIQRIEQEKLLDTYSIAKIKADFDMQDMPGMFDVMDINTGAHLDE